MNDIVTELRQQLVDKELILGLIQRSFSDKYVILTLILLSLLICTIILAKVLQSPEEHSRNDREDRMLKKEKKVICITVATATLCLISAIMVIPLVNYHSSLNNQIRSLNRLPAQRFKYTYASIEYVSSCLQERVLNEKFVFSSIDDTISDVLRLKLVTESSVRRESKYFVTTIHKMLNVTYFYCLWPYISKDYLISKDDFDGQMELNKYTFFDICRENSTIFSPVCERAYKSNTTLWDIEKYSSMDNLLYDFVGKVNYKNKILGFLKAFKIWFISREFMMVYKDHPNDLLQHLIDIGRKTVLSKLQSLQLEVEVRGNQILNQWHFLSLATAYSISFVVGLLIVSMICITLYLILNDQSITAIYSLRPIYILLNTIQYFLLLVLFLSVILLFLLSFFSASFDQFSQDVLLIKKLDNIAETIILKEKHKIIVENRFELYYKWNISHHITYPKSIFSSIILKCQKKETDLFTAIGWKTPVDVVGIMNSKPVLSFFRKKIEHFASKYEGKVETVSKILNKYILPRLTNLTGIIILEYNLDFDLESLKRDLKLRKEVMLNDTNFFFPVVMEHREEMERLYQLVLKRTGYKLTTYKTAAQDYHDFMNKFTKLENDRSNLLNLLEFRKSFENVIRYIDSQKDILHKWLGYFQSPLHRKELFDHIKKSVLPTALTRIGKTFDLLITDVQDSLPSCHEVNSLLFSTIKHVQMLIKDLQLWLLSIVISILIILNLFVVLRNLLPE